MSWRRGQTAILTQVSSRDHSSTSSSSWLELLNRGSLRAQIPLSAAGSHFGILSPTVHLVILLFYVHLLPPFFRLFTQAHLLTDGSVESQYIYIYIYISCCALCHEHGFTWLCLFIRLYRPSHLAYPLDYILCLLGAVVDRFLLDA